MIKNLQATSSNICEQPASGGATGSWASVLLLVLLTTMLSFGSFAGTVPQILIKQESRELQAPAGTAFQWYHGSDKLTAETGRNLHIRNSGAYTVTYLNQQGQEVQQQITIQVRQDGTIKRVFLIGDSTVQDYTDGWNPQKGWGQVLPHFFDKEHVAIHNRAVGGTSSKSFYDSFWPAVKEELQTGDYIFIQFGHNDRNPDPARFTDAYTTFKTYLRNYVNEARAKGAIPVLVTPMHRNAWTGTEIYNAWHDHPPAMRQVAAELTVPLIDLHNRSEVLFEALGQAYVTDYIFLHLKPGEYPRSPAGLADNVHFKEMGALEMAKLLVEGIKALSTHEQVGPLVPHIKPMYEVTASANLTEVNSFTRKSSYPAGATVTLKVQAPGNFTFTGWTDAAGALKSSTLNYSFMMPEKDLAFEANFAAEEKTTFEAGGTYLVKVQHSQLYLDINGSSLNNAALLVQNPYSSNASQQFTFREVGEGYYNVVAVHSNKALDVEARSMADGARLMQYTTGTGTNQQFRIVQTADGFYQLIARHSGKCVQVPNASSDAALNLTQVTCSDTAPDQKFAFYRIITTSVTGEQAKNDLAVQVYPNPSLTGFKISTGFGRFNYTIYDARGAAQETGEGDAQNAIGSSLKAGLYFIKVQAGSGSTVIRVLKQ